MYSHRLVDQGSNLGTGPALEFSFFFDRTSPEVDCTGKVMSSPPQPKCTCMPAKYPLQERYGINQFKAPTVQIIAKFPRNGILTYVYTYKCRVGSHDFVFVGYVSSVVLDLYQSVFDTCTSCTFLDNRSRQWFSKHFHEI